ncbi:MAG: hypothetical protein ACJAS9_001890 [Polaribacter sp.]|jgi:hypothetical protein
MFISHTPINLPVSTANMAVESLEKEASIKPQIPETNPANQGSNSKHATDFSEQNKPTLLDSLIQDKTMKEANEQKQQNEKESEDGQNDGSKPESVNKNGNSRSELELDLSEQKEVAKLQARDNEVRAHETAHASVGGSLAGSPNLNYTSGPDGKRYATSGDVSIDTSKVANDPSATIQKLQQVQRAALAPAQPSSQDRKVAAIASAGASEAQVELRFENLEASKQLSEKQTEKSEQEDVVNPVRALRESRALEQKIVNSGALENQSELNKLSLIA